MYRTFIMTYIKSNKKSVEIKYPVDTIRNFCRLFNT